ncbi:MAG: discoidin domain-containing protein [Bacteroidota bacterium]
MYPKILFTLIFAIYFIQLQAQCVDPNASIWEDTWQSCQVSDSPNPARGEGHWIQYDFGENYALSTSYIWNTNASGESDKGFRNVVVDYSVNGEEWNELGTYEFPQAPETARYGGFQGFDFEGVSARYVLITAIDNWGHGSCYGLAEVKFNLKPIQEIFELPCEELPCDEECRAPERAAAFVILPFEALLIWEDTDLATSYTVRYRLEEGEWTTVETEEPELFLEGLIPEQNYEFEIIANCAEGEMVTSPLFSFNTPAEQTECGPPVSTNWFAFGEEEVTISCYEVPGAERYRFRYRKADSNDPWVEVESDENFVDIEGLESETAYEYQISVECEDGWTAYTSSYNFNTRIDALTNTNNLADQLLAFELFPNPAQSTAFIQLNSTQAEAISLVVSNVMGQVVYRRAERLVAGEQTLAIQLDRMGTGMYFVTLIQDNTGHKLTQRLVVVDN